MGFLEEYDVRVPVVSAGMAFIARAPLAAAVSQAGAIGTLGATGMPAELLEAEVGAIRGATDRPFAVNLIGRFAEAVHVELCARLAVPVVTFFWDPPEAAWVETLKAAGVRVWIQVGSPQDAVDAVSAGADAVIAQGLSAGGHNLSTAGTISLVPAVVDAIGPTPVIAAGGIADGRGVAAALALGAGAALLGTRFLVADEADAHPGYQDRVLAAGVGDTALNDVFGFDFPDARVRGLRNAIVAEFEGRDDPPPYRDLDPAQQPVIGTASVFGQEVPMARHMGLPPTAAATGDLDQMSLLAGESAGLISDRRPAAEIVAALERELASAVAGLRA